MQTDSLRGRRRYSAAEKQRLIRQWLDSGKTAKEFGRLHDIRPQSLWRWKSAQKLRESPSAGFHEVVVSDAFARETVDEHNRRTALIEIDDPSGQSIRVFGGADPQWVAAILRAACRVAPPC